MTSAPSQVLVHLALLAGQSINGGASVVAKIGLPRINPVFFALLREFGASPLLLAVALLAHGCSRIALKDVPILGFASFCLFSSQLTWTIGLKLGNPVVGAAWQPSQPVFVLGLAVMLRWEKCTVAKTAGVLCALVGGAVMTFCSSDMAHSKSTAPLIGNLLFFYNCLTTSLFILCMRVITQRMPKYFALALVYIICSVGIFLVALAVSASYDLQHFLCPDCTEDFWVFPPGALFALAYWILGCSVSGYLLLTFGTRHAKDATHCLAYTAMQPVVAGVLEAALVAAGWNQAHSDSQLKLLNCMQVFGACLVVFGVACVAFESKICPQQADCRSPFPNNSGHDQNSLQPMVCEES